jgi:hypothetical protein
MSSLCKYCQKVELVFDNAHKSKSGRLIPLDKQSGLPHNCAENPYNTKQQEQSGRNIPTNTAQTETTEQQPSTDFQVLPELVDKGITAFSMLSSLIKLVEQNQKELVTLNEKVEHLTKLVYALSSSQSQSKK